MTAPALSDDILTGLPLPTRGRWQPQRAGITGLFHYDAQVFTFYRGRLLLRGNNGNGKSMALEVLLPFVLAADTEPGQLSTFGDRNRSMYTWLLGHDGAGKRASARGYVWVEFGRLGPLGQPEYFTVGAGMEALRSGEKLSGLWYFTTAARIGVDLHVGTPGGETPTKDVLIAQLHQLSQQDLPGDVRGSKAHRIECNRVLFGLPQDSYQSLLKALRQLRRPKLSDKLSQKALAEILRDALPSLDKTLFASLASGYERLDRHQATIKELQETIASLRELDAAYRRYARAHLWQRAQAITNGHTVLERAAKKADSAAATRDRLAGEVDALTAQETELNARRSEMAGQLAGLQDSPDYREGRQLEPRREQAETLEGVARDYRKQADDAAEQAEHATDAATEAHLLAETHNTEATRQHSAVEQGAQLVTLLHRIYEDLHAQLRDSPDGVQEPVLLELRRQLRQAVADLRRRLQVLIAIEGRAAEANKAVEAAAQDVEQARLSLVTADEHVATVGEQMRRARDEFLAAARRWLADCTQLTASGVVWNDPEPARISTAWPAWRDSAHRARIRQLGALAQRLNSADAVAVEKNASQNQNDLRMLVSRARETAVTLDEALESYATAQSDWLLELTGWVGGLTYLPTHGATLPPTNQYDPARWKTWAEAALVTHDAQISTAEHDLQQRQRAHDLAQHECDQESQRLTQERDTLAADITGAPRTPFTRLDSRDGRPGAAFYTLIDFTENVETARMPALEAALFGSGLADAWLHPDGVLSSPNGTPLADTQLDPTIKPVEHALSTALHADPDAAHTAGLPVAAITAILAGVGLADTARGTPGDLTLGWDGSWRAGPLHGAYRQPTAVLIGAARRERVRQARLAVLNQQLSELAGKLREYAAAGQLLEAEAVQLRTARDEARAEAAGVPPTTIVDLAKKNVDDAEQNARVALERAQSRQPEAHAALSRLHQQRTDDLAAVAAAGPVPGTLQLPDAATTMAPSPSLSQLDEYAQASAAILDAIATVVDQTRQGLRNAAELADQELEAFPPAIRALQEIERDASRAEQDQAAARSRFSERKKDHTQKLTTKAEQQQILAGALAEADLTGWDTRLHDLPPKIDSWLENAEDWLTALTTHHATAVAASHATRAANTAVARAAEAAKRATTEENRAVAAREHYNQLAARIGTDYTSLMADITELETKIGETDKALTKNRADQLLKVGQHRAAEERAKTDTDAHRQVADALPALADKLWAAVTADLHRAAGWDVSPPAADDDPAQRANAAALHIQELAGTDADRQHGPDHNDDLANEVYTRRHAAEANLRGQLTLIEKPVADLLIIEAVRDTTTATLPATIADLNTEVVNLQIMLTTEESKLLEQFLTDSVRHQVTSHIEAANKQIKDMSNTMQKHRTSAGYRFALEWIPAPGAEVDKHVLDLMNADFGVAPSAKERLRDFFAARIAKIRATRSGQTWEALLEEMLDYRGWYQFQLHYAKGDNDFAELDNTHFAKLSGGEKSVALHLPLFAAAATHTVAAAVRDTEDPQKPGCPRLILLDEVFAGVDEDMRGELFDLVTSLDMDLVATSEAETGMYAELDGIAIYHLIRSAGIPGVLAARSIWTGSDATALLDNDLGRGL